jgi:hypothetical protein
MSEGMTSTREFRPRKAAVSQVNNNASMGTEPKKSLSIAKWRRSELRELQRWASVIFTDETARKIAVIAAPIGALPRSRRRSVHFGQIMWGAGPKAGLVYRPHRPSHSDNGLVPSEGPKVPGNRTR